VCWYRSRHGATDQQYSYLLGGDRLGSPVLLAVVRLTEPLRAKGLRAVIARALRPRCKQAGSVSLLRCSHLNTETGLALTPTACHVTGVFLIERVATLAARLAG